MKNIGTLALKRKNKLNVIIVARWLGFPNGMATTQRVRLLAQGMVENGADVSVLILFTSERPPLIENPNPKGNYQGVSFEYTAGTSIRPDNFIKRRWLEIKSYFVLICRLIQLKREGKLNVIYIWGFMQTLSISLILICLLAKALKVIVVSEIDEMTWSLKENGSLLEGTISPLIGTSGAITISKYLYGWVNQEAKKSKKPFQVLKIPIVADVNEEILFDEIIEQMPPTILFAGSPAYDSTIRFILDAMPEVWKHYPNCRLTITGCRDDDPMSAWIKKEITVHKLNNVELAGYLDRQILLKRYVSARALLIPLFNDVRSTARFPTKIGEYLLSGRPIITNSVGDVTQFLEDGVSAFICEPNNTKAYAEKIIEVIKNPSHATSVGAKGKQVAIESFHYGLYGKKLVDFFTSQALKTS